MEPCTLLRVVVTVTECDCIMSLDPEWEGHTVEDHDAEYCKAGWTLSGPPCGGCINCIQAQMYYYKFLDEQKKKNADTSDGTES